MNYTMSKDHIKAMIVFLKEKQNKCIVTHYADLFFYFIQILTSKAQDRALFAMFFKT